MTFLSTTLPISSVFLLIVVHKTAAFTTHIQCSNRPEPVNGLIYSNCSIDFLCIQNGRLLTIGPNRHDSLSRLSASGVPEHNGTVLNADWLTELPYPATVLNTSVLLMYRFLPHNLMHAMHDDTLPLWTTLHSLNTQLIRPINLLLLVDPYSTPDPFQLLSPILHKYNVQVAHLSAVSGLVCFRRAYVGLSERSLFYDYGFDTPQHVRNTQPDMHHWLITYVQQYKRYHQVSAPVPVAKDCQLLVLTRKDTRRILNTNELVMGLYTKTGCLVRTAGLEHYSLKELVGLVQDSDVLIGVHGALLAVTLFARANTLLVELFPAGVDCELIQPYRQLAQLVHTQYKAWIAPASKSVVNPDLAEMPHFGGLNHLSLARQEEIRNMIMVQAFLCCDDENWLYRIYHDLHVDVHHISQFCADHLKLE